MGKMGKRVVVALLLLSLCLQNHSVVAFAGNADNHEISESADEIDAFSDIYISNDPSAALDIDLSNDFNTSSDIDISNDSNTSSDTEIIDVQAEEEYQIEISDDESEDESPDTAVFDDSFSWNLSSDGTLTISGSGNFYEFCYLDELENYRKNTKKIVFEKGLEIISVNFTDYENLKEVVFPEGLKEIAGYTFVNCKNLEKVNLPGSIEYIYKGIFEGCDKLKTAGPTGSSCNIEYGWKEALPDCAFSGCDKMENITLPNSLVTIGREVFKDCASLCSIDIPKSVTVIKNGCFEGCSSLEKISLPAVLEDIPMNLFKNCSSLKSVDMPKHLHDGYIRAEAFRGCSSLEEIAVPDSVLEIEIRAFNNSGLKKITIPGGFQKIWPEVFKGCKSLKDVYFSGNRSNWDTVSIYADNDELYDADFHYSEKYAEGKCGDNITWTIDNGKLVISGTGETYDYKWGAPWGKFASEIVEVEISSGITYIGKGIFSSYIYENARKLSFPGTVKKIALSSFDGLDRLTDVYFYGTKAEYDALVAQDLIFSYDTKIHIMNSKPSPGPSQPKGLPFTITFDANGGTVEESSKTANTGEKLGVLPPATQSGFIFLGWFTEKDGGTQITKDSVFKDAKDITLYAHWRKESATTLALDYEQLQLSVGESKVITAYTIPSGYEAGIVWSSSSDAVATVSNGEIKAISPGRTVITATIADSGLSASCVVTVIGSDISIDDEDIATDPEFNVPGGLWTAGLLPSYSYTGAKITPAFRVYYGNTLLREKTEYTVSYKDNVNAGTAKAIITGKGNYAGKCTVEFMIDKLSLSSDDVDVTAGTENGGKAVKPVVAVIHNGLKLKEKKDYKLDYPTITAAGSYTVKVTGTGNYTGEVDKTFVVKAKNSPSLGKASVSGLAKSYTLADIKKLMADTSALSVKVNKQAVSKEEYAFKFENCDQVGKGTLVVYPSENSSYVGEKRVAVNITGEKLGSVKTSIGLIYNAKPQNLSVEVYSKPKFQGEVLPKSAYTVEYAGSTTNAGTVTVTITGNPKAGYTGKLSAKCNIQARSIDDDSVEVTMPEHIYYTQGGTCPTPLVTYNNGLYTYTLREGIDYSVSYANNKDVSSKKAPTCTITGKGNFSGKKAPISFGIEARNLSTLAVSCADIQANSSKKGKYYYSKPLIVDTNGKALKEGTDYKVTYFVASTADPIGSNEVLSEGTLIRAEISALGKNYTGSTSVTYKVAAVAKDISKASVGKIANKEYTGKAIEISNLDVKLSSGSGASKVTSTLVEGKDYIITGYYNNVKKGTASLRIEGRGEYTGAKIVTFKIVAGILFDF